MICSTGEVVLPFCLEETRLVIFGSFAFLRAGASEGVTDLSSILEDDGDGRCLWTRSIPCAVSSQSPMALSTSSPESSTLLVKGVIERSSVPDDDGDGRSPWVWSFPCTASSCSPVRLSIPIPETPALPIVEIDMIERLEGERGLSGTRLVSA